MTQDVAFKGLACSPSDNSAQDGELGTCLNLVPEDGELRPIAQPEIVDDSGFLTEGVTIEYVHKVSYDGDITTHYICYNSKVDIWFWHIPGETDEDWYPIHLPGDGEFHVNSVTSIGNILCFVGDDDIWYAFWDSDTDIYKVFNQSDPNSIPMKAWAKLLHLRTMISGGSLTKGISIWTSRKNCPIRQGQKPTRQ